MRDSILVISIVLIATAFAGCSNAVSVPKNPSDIRSGTPASEVYKSLGRPKQWHNVDLQTGQITATTYHSGGIPPMPANIIWMWTYENSSGEEVVMTIRDNVVSKVVTGENDPSVDKPSAADDSLLKELQTALTNKVPPLMCFGPSGSFHPALPKGFSKIDPEEWARARKLILSPLFVHTQEKGDFAGVEYNKWAFVAQVAERGVLSGSADLKPPALITGKMPMQEIRDSYGDPSATTTFVAEDGARQFVYWYGPIFVVAEENGKTVSSHGGFVSLLYSTTPRADARRIEELFYGKGTGDR